MKSRFLIILLINLTLFANAQKSIKSPEYNYENLKEGTYKYYSDSKDYLNLELPYLDEKLKKITDENYPFFLNPYENEIVLFENHDLKNLKPIVKLNRLIQVRIDSTFYKHKYKDMSNCVWNRIIINEKAYYTDIDIHDFALFKILENYNQKIYIIGQFEGYDGAYHLGYPEYLFLLFTDKENNLISKTNVLNFELNNEYAMEDDILEINWNKSLKEYKIILKGLSEKIEIDWNGSKSEIKKL